MKAVGLAFGLLVAHISPKRATNAREMDNRSSDEQEEGWVCDQGSEVGADTTLTALLTHALTSVAACEAILTTLETECADARVRPQPQRHSPFVPLSAHAKAADTSMLTSVHNEHDSAETTIVKPFPSLSQIAVPRTPQPEPAPQREQFTPNVSMTPATVSTLTFQLEQALRQSADLQALYLTLNKQNIELCKQVGESAKQIATMHQHMVSLQSATLALHHAPTTSANTLAPPRETHSPFSSDLENRLSVANAQLADLGAALESEIRGSMAFAQASAEAQQQLAEYKNIVAQQRTLIAALEFSKKAANMKPLPEVSSLPRTPSQPSRTAPQQTPPAHYARSASQQGRRTPASLQKTGSSASLDESLSKPSPAQRRASAISVCFVGCGFYVLIEFENVEFI